MKQITWSFDKRKVADLKPADYNPRKLSDKARADLTASVKEFGEVEPVVINKDGGLIGGHQRVKVYTDLGIEEITVRVPSRQLSEAEEKRLNLRLNKNVGEWDWGKLKEFEQTLLLEVGFTDEEMKIGFGLDSAGKADVSEDRMALLTIYPPESPRLKEKLAIHMPTIEAYEKVKEAVETGELTAEKIIKLV